MTAGRVVSLTFWSQGATHLINSALGLVVILLLLLYREFHGIDRGRGGGMCEDSPNTFPPCATRYSSKEYHSHCFECEWCSLECYHSRSSLYSTSPNPGSEECYPERLHETCADGQWTADTLYSESRLYTHLTAISERLETMLEG